MASVDERANERPTSSRQRSLQMEEKVMRKIISVAGSVGALVLSLGTAFAQSSTMRTPAAPPIDNDTGNVTVGVPQAQPATGAPQDPSTPTAEPVPLPGPTPPPAGAPGPYSPSVNERDARDNQYVERGSGTSLPGSVVGAGVLLGGGVQDFSRSNARDVTNTGGFWNARVVAGTREFIGLEGAYVGSAQGINALGLDSDAVLISNGVEGAVRLNLPILVARSATLLEPFVFGGAGWSRFHVARTSVNTSDIATDDDVLTIPYGAGMMVAYHGLMADARFTYRSTFYNDLLRTTGGSLDTWSAGAQVGFEF
jgi:hypothetical protein